MSCLKFGKIGFDSPDFDLAVEESKRASGKVAHANPVTSSDSMSFSERNADSHASTENRMRFPTERVRTFVHGKVVQRRVSQPSASATTGKWRETWKRVYSRREPSGAGDRAVKRKFPPPYAKMKIEWNGSRASLMMLSMM